jgi:hypothetical protein
MSKSSLLLSLKPDIKQAQNYAKKRKKHEINTSVSIKKLKSIKFKKKRQKVLPLQPD